MNDSIHTIKPVEGFTIAGMPATDDRTAGGLSLPTITDGDKTANGLTVPRSMEGTIDELTGLIVPRSGLVRPESKILIPPGNKVPIREAGQPQGLNQAEVVRFASNPLLYVRKKLIEQIDELTIEQGLLLKMLFEDMEVTDARTYTILVQPKITQSEYFDKRSGKRLPMEHTGPSDFEEMATNILEILSTVGDVPNTPGVQIVLSKLTTFGIRALKAHAHGAYEYSKDFISLRGGRIYKAGYEVLEKSVLSKNSRRELYRFLDLFEVSTEFAEGILERMDELDDLETPFASRLLINVLHQSGERRSPFVQEQIRRSKVIKDVYEEATPLERGSYSFMETMCKMAKGVIFDIEALEGKYGKKVGFEVEFRPILTDETIHVMPEWLEVEDVVDEHSLFELKTTKEDINLGTSYLLRLDDLRRYLNLYARNAQGSSHMHLDEQDFPDEPCVLLGKLDCYLNMDDSKADTWELRGGLPIDLFHENNVSTFINFILYHTSTTNLIQINTNLPIETTQHAQWLTLERIATRPDGLIAKLRALNTGTILSLLGSIENTTFFEAWATLPKNELLGYLRVEEELYNNTHTKSYFLPDNVSNYLYERQSYDSSPIPLTARAKALLLQQYGSNLVRKL